MRILELRAQNVKNLKVVEIKPDKNAVILTGKNGTGKSSILDCILMALTGKKIEKPIREGQDKAEVEMNLGQFRVKKIWTASGERLEVSNPEGSAKYASPQALLNKILGELSFDPLAFKEMEDDRQRTLLLKVVGLDLSEMGKKKETIYADRTVFNRHIKSLAVQLDAMEKPEGELPEGEISLAGELAKITELENRQDLFQKYKEHIAKREDKIKSLNRIIKQCELDIERIKDDMARAEKELKEEKIALQNETSRAPAEITSEQISVARREVEKVEGINVKVRAAKARKQIELNLREASADANKLSAELEKIDKEKIEKIKTCKFPVPGLGISDTAVLFEGIPFSQLSTGQQVRISTAMAMALNPKLKIILVREGSLLDQDGLKAVVEMATDKDYQIWIERCDEKGGAGIHLEDGTVVAVDGKSVENS